MIAPDKATAKPVRRNAKFLKPFISLYKNIPNKFATIGGPELPIGNVIA